LSNWEKKEVTIRLQASNRKLNKEFKTLAVKESFSAGKPEGFTTLQMGSRKLKELQPRVNRIDKVRSRREFEKFSNGMERLLSDNVNSDKDIAYRQHYFQAMDNVFGSKADKLRQIVEEIPTEILVEKYETDEEAGIDFFYDPLDADFKLEILEEYWGDVANDLIERGIYGIGDTVELSEKAFRANMEEQAIKDSNLQAILDKQLEKMEELRIANLNALKKG